MANIVTNLGFENTADMIMNSLRDDNISSDALARWRDDIDSEIESVADDTKSLSKYIRDTEAEIRRIENLKSQLESAKARLAASIEKQDMLSSRRNLIENMMVVMSYMEEN